MSYTAVSYIGYVVIPLLAAVALLLVSASRLLSRSRPRRPRAHHEAAAYWLRTAELELEARDDGLAPETLEHLEQLKILGDTVQQAEARKLLGEDAGAGERLAGTGEIPALVIQSSVELTPDEVETLTKRFLAAQGKPVRVLPQGYHPQVGTGQPPATDGGRYPCEDCGKHIPRTDRVRHTLFHKGRDRMLLQHHQHGWRPRYIAAMHLDGASTFTTDGSLVCKFCGRISAFYPPPGEADCPERNR